MNQNNRTKLAALIMTVGLAGFFWSFAYFHVFGSRINYTDPTEMLKLGCGLGCLLIGLFVGIYLYAGKQLAIRVAGRLAALLLICYVLGFILHRDSWR